MAITPEKGWFRPMSLREGPIRAVPYLYPPPNTDPETKQVIDYLNKKGYSQTEAALRVEMKKRERDPSGALSRAEDKGPDQYSIAFSKFACL